MSLKIAVLVKQVADPEALVQVKSGDEIEVEPKLVTSFFDEIAVEQALRLRDEVGGTVTAVTVGGGKAVDALRRAMAMGANGAIQIDDPALEGADGLAIARSLAALLKAEQSDLILCGRASSDLEAGFVGPALAELLDVPHAMSVVGLELGDDNSLVVKRQVERGVEVLRIPLPAVIGAQKGLCEPRVPKVMQVMKAGKAPIDKRDLAALGLGPETALPVTRVLSYEAPKQRGPVHMVEGDFPGNVDELLRLLREEAKVVP